MGLHELHNFGIAGVKGWKIPACKGVIELTVASGIRSGGASQTHDNFPNEHLGSALIAEFRVLVGAVGVVRCAVQQNQADCLPLLCSELCLPISAFTAGCACVGDVAFRTYIGLNAVGDFAVHIMDAHTT